MYLPESFSLSVTCTYIRTPIKMHWPRLFLVVSREMHNFTFIGSQSFISSFMFVGAAVSEIRELNWNKEKQQHLQNGYFQFNTFPGHVIDPFFHKSDHIYTLNLLEV